jgi:hypothetical protein
MENEERSSVVPAIVGRIVVSTVIILIVVGLIYWIADWSTAYQYGTGLMIAGLFAIVLGFLDVAGSMRSTRSYIYQQAESAGYDTGHDRVVEAKATLAETYSFLFVMGASGLLCIVIGLVVRAVA